MQEGPAGCGLDRANWTYAVLASRLYRTHGIAVSKSIMRSACAKHGVHPSRPTSRDLRRDPEQPARARQDLEWSAIWIVTTPSPSSVPSI
jgi:hypothetical protein